MQPVITTYSGLKVNLKQFSRYDVRIQDIAHGLAICNRFAGQTGHPISVAQHSVYVSRLCGEANLERCQGLLHDASEAYAGDITKWLKEQPEMEWFREQVEKPIQECIYKRYDCATTMYNKVAEADKLMVRYEGFQGFGKDWKVGHENYTPLTEQEIQRVDSLFGPWRFWTWDLAEDMFLSEFLAIF